MTGGQWMKALFCHPGGCSYKCVMSR